MLIGWDVLAALLSALHLTTAAETRDSARPRGVGPEFAKFYKATPDSLFTCISHPTLRIPSTAVNDNYCDCPDGSDEPGTAACSYLSPLSPPQPDLNSVSDSNTRSAHPNRNSNITLSLPGFYCKNKGHVPNYIRFEIVDDGICDYDVCCDGSDESSGVVKCEDRCARIGSEYRAREETRQKGLQRAMKRKRELLFLAATARKELEDKIEATEITIKGLERRVGEAEENVRETERREKTRVVRSEVLGREKGRGGGKLSVLVGLGRERVQELRGTLLTVRGQRDDMVKRVTELEGLLSELKETYNPNFNDAGVKKAVKGWEDYAARESTDGWSDGEDRDVLEIAKEDGPDGGINWAEFESGEGPGGDDDGQSDAAAIYSLTAYLPPVMQSWVSGAVAGLRQMLIDNGLLPDHSVAANIDESQAVKNARQARDNVQKELTDANNDLHRDKEDINRDYGPEGIFRAIKDMCVDKESGEYKYSHCFLQKTTQQPKKGGGQTNMGNFVGFDVEYVDDDLPADGKGLGRGDRIVMKYENGQHCWSGPNRSTRIVLACSETDEIFKISESEKCVYRMEVGTPAVCGWENKPDSNGAAPQAGAKDEL